ncbi:MAG: HipA domain-containing protein [bacterium]|nr:HipA domain-containing protein [bacterium]
MELAVLIGGAMAGTLDLSGREPAFTYNQDYASGTGPPLSVRFPLTGLRAEGKELRFWLEGLLPDHPETLRALRAEHELAYSDTLHLLGTPMGADCAGAVQFCPPEQALALATKPGGADPISTAEIAEWLKAISTNPALRVQRSLSSDSGFSLAGMQPKVAVRRTTEDGWAVPYGAVPTTHIIKAVRSDAFPHEAVVEHLTQAIAARCGLPAAHTTTDVYDGLEVIIVKRYDRLADASGRIHQEDMCQVLSRPPDLKYQRDGGPSPDEIAEVLNTHCEGTGDLERFCDYLLFQWITASTDGHAKNYGLMLLGAGIVRLAPLYDTASWLPYHRGQSNRLIRLSMKMGKDYRLQSADRPSAIQHTSRRLGLQPLAVAERAARLAAAVPAAIGAALDTLPGEMAGIAEVDTLVSAVCERAALCEAIAHRVA